MKGLMYLEKYSSYKHRTRMDKLKSKLFIPVTFVTLVLSILQIKDLIYSREVIKKEIVNFQHKGQVLPIQKDTVFVESSDSVKISPLKK